MRIVILGAPGSGKRTQTDLLANKYGLSSVMTGELVKNAVLKRTPLGLEIKELQEAGRVVTEDIVLALLRERLLKSELQDGFVLDGFPRNLLQALTLDELMIEIDQPLDLILLIDIETDTLMERLVGRRTCRSCGLLYNIYRNPPVVDGVCDVCGGRLHQRSDDNEETVSSRIHVFDHLISPLITHYGKQGKLVKIDGNGEINQVFQLICKTIDEGSRQSAQEASIEAQPVLEERAEESVKSQVLEEAGNRSAAEAVAPATVESREKRDKVSVPNKVVKKKATRKKATRKKAETKRAASKQTSKKKPVARRVVKKKASKKKSSTRTAAKSRAVKKKSSTHRTVQKKPVKKQPSKKKLSKKKTLKSKVAAKKRVTKKKAAARPSAGNKAKATTVRTKKRGNVSAKSDRTAVRQRGKTVKKRAKVKAKAKKRVSTKGVVKKRTPNNTGMKKVTAKVSSGKKTAVKKTKSKRSKSRKK